MFKKFVSNLPFNPSLIDRLPEYKAKLRKELRLRVIGLVLLLIAFVLQLFITLFPPTPSVVTSPNNLLKNGFSSESQAFQYCNDNNQGFRDVLSFYSISCNDLAGVKTTLIRPDSFNKQLYSINRVPYGNTDENLAYINKTNYWVRPLWQGSALKTEKLSAIDGINNNGDRFFILFNSGNLVFIGQPRATVSCYPNDSLNCPKLFITARSGQVDNANHTVAKPEDTIIYTLVATNYAKQTINNYEMSDNFSSALSYSNILNLYGGTFSNNYISWPAQDILSGQSVTHSVSFIIKAPVPNTALSSADSNYFNMKMVTTFGNTVVINLPMSFTKFFELNINNSFPSVSRFTGLIISLLLVLFVVYLVCRNILLLKELNGIKDDYLSGGDSES